MLTQVVLTADGGFATSGFTYAPRNGSGIESIVVAKYTAVGVLQWQTAYNEDNGTQVPISFAQTSDGGYIVGGATSAISGGAAGGLLLKLGSRGNIQWQKAYSSALGGNVVYSVHQTAGTSLRATVRVRLAMG